MKKQNNKVKKSIKNTVDIYESRNIDNAENAYSNIAQKRYSKMLSNNSHIVPRNYRKFENENYSNNSDSEYSDDENSNNSDKMSVSSDDNNNDELGAIENMQNNRKFENRIAKRNKFCETDTWDKQFEKMTFDNGGQVVSSNGIHDTSDLVKRNEIERNFELANDFSKYEADNNDGTLGIIDANSPEFIHENMKPFVRRGPNPINEEKRNMVNNMKLETFTGTNDPMWKPKIERKPLFEPITNASNLYGDPVRTEDFKSRYFAGRYTNNDLPFQQVKTTPGLDIGYNGVGKHGYHDMYRAVPRNIDELRPLSKPRKSYGSYSGPAVAQNPNGSIIGNVSQYKAPTFSERGTADMIRGGKSYISAPTVYGNYDKTTLATDNRGTKSNVVSGPAQANTTGITPGKYRANYAPSRKENFVNDPQRNIAGYESFVGQGHNNKSFITDLTLRDVHNQYDRSGNATGEKYGHQAIDYKDTPNATLRDIHGMTDRTGQIQGNNYGHQAIDYKDTPNTTMRNIHEEFDRSGQIQGNRFNYQAINYKDIPDTTMRNIHEEFDRTGQIQGNNYGHQAIDYKDIPDTTMRNIHEEFDRTGQIQGNNYGHQAIDYKDTPDTTMRNIHEEFDRSGHIGNTLKYNYRAIDYKDIPTNTMRNIHEKTERAGHIGNASKYDHRAIDYKDTPNNTMRNIHEKTERAGHIGHTSKFDYRAINYDDIPNTTMREINNGEVKWPSKYIINNQGSRRHYSNMMVNGAKEALEEGRAPTKVGVNKGWTLDNTVMRLRHPLKITWRPGENSSMPYSNYRVPSLNTHTLMEKRSWNNDRINMYPELNLQGNEFVNNLVHKAVPV